MCDWPSPANSERIEATAGDDEETSFTAGLPDPGGSFRLCVEPGRRLRRGVLVVPRPVSSRALPCIILFFCSVCMGWLLWDVASTAPIEAGRSRIGGLPFDGNVWASTPSTKNQQYDGDKRRLSMVSSIQRRRLLKFTLGEGRLPT